MRTSEREETRDITDRVRGIVRASKVGEGTCLVRSAHTTAGVFVNENADVDVQRDLLATLRKVVPDAANYAHAEENSPAHIKAILVGADATVAVRGGELELGRWQGIFFAEFDGPRERVATVTVSGTTAR